MGIHVEAWRGWRGQRPPLIDHREVARLAHELYMQRGCVEGHALEDWVTAEEIVRRRALEGSTPVLM